MAVFDVETLSYWVSPVPKDKSGVVYDELSDEDKKISMLHDSRKSRTCWPKNIIPANILDKWNLQDDGTVSAKSRSVLVGWKDPMIYLVGARCTHSNTRRYHGDTSVLGISKRCRAASQIRPTLLVRHATRHEKQARHQVATWSDTSIGGTRTAVAC